jgi:hypothetical protein
MTDRRGLVRAGAAAPLALLLVLMSGLVPDIFPANGLPRAAAAFAALPRTGQVDVADRLRQQGAVFTPRQIEQSVDDF